MPSRSFRMRPLLWTIAPATGALALALAFVGCSASPSSEELGSATQRAVTVSVVTNRYDNGRTGANPNESILTPSNVASASFSLLFSRPVDGQIYAQPLYVPALSIAGATHNVVYVATEHNSVYAFDADDPNASAPLWQVSLGTPGPMNPGQ